MDKKIVLIGIDVEADELEQLAHGMSNLGNYLGYKFIFINKTDLKAFTKDDLREMLKTVQE